MPSYAYRILPDAELSSAVEPGEVKLLAHYLKHLQRLRRGGSVRLIGRGQTGDPAFLLVDAQDEVHARTIARSDPAVSEGLMRIARRASLAVLDGGTGHCPTAKAPPDARLRPTARQL